MAMPSLAKAMIGMGTGGAALMGAAAGFGVRGMAAAEAGEFYSYPLTAVVGGLGTVGAAVAVPNMVAYELGKPAGGRGVALKVGLGAALAGVAALSSVVGVRLAEWELAK